MPPATPLILRSPRRVIVLREEVNMVARSALCTRRLDRAGGPASDRSPASPMPRGSREGGNDV
jgi:hypothetical protein